MKKIIIFTLLLLIGVFAYSQPQENIWMFGASNALDFSGPSPITGGIPAAGGNPPAWNYERSGAVCNSAGQLQFWVKLQYNPGPGAATLTNVFSGGAQPMPNGQLRSDLPGQGVPLIVPMPGNSSRYYLFYIKNGGLLYSVVDMSLNGGLGDVVPAEKNILLAGWGTLIDHKLLAVAGCNGVWIIVRSKNTNEYYSYQLTAAGVTPSPVVSQAGLLPYGWYGAGNDTYAGVMKASPDGTRIAVASNGQSLPAGAEQGGLELYRFERCSGRLLEPVLLDSGSYYGVCFSPDGSRLYATRIFLRQLYQFDLTQPTTAAIIASKTLIFTNYVYPPVLPDRYLLGDLKAGSDAKIYLGNNVCTHPSYVNALHVISQPNLAGLSCALLPNALVLGNAGACTGLDLPASIVTGPLQDTVKGGLHYVSACFREQTELTAAPGGSCYSWDDTVFSQTLTVTAPGLHIARYTGADCRMHIDSYTVAFPRLPLPGAPSFSCPGERAGRLVMAAAPGDTTRFHYTWKDASGNLLAHHEDRQGDTLTGLLPGTYTVHITTPFGCDTTLELAVLPLPEPEASFQAPETACAGVPITFLNTSPAPIWLWQFGDGTEDKTRDPEHTFYAAGNQTVSLTVQNIEGCRDTATQQTDITTFTLRLTTDRSYADRGETVRLETGSSEPYQVDAWLPYPLFPGQEALSQALLMDSTVTVIVTGQSSAGCRDTATLTLQVKPHIMIPSAFSPNGDGLNDLFSVTSWGAPLFIRFLEVYNRWGQLVYRGSGKGNNGWDGTFQGQSAEAGTYFYTVTIETPQGTTYTQKGDVTLIR